MDLRLSSGSKTGDSLIRLVQVLLHRLPADDRRSPNRYSNHLLSVRLDVPPLQVAEHRHDPIEVPPVVVSVDTRGRDSSLDQVKADFL